MTRPSESLREIIAQKLEPQAWRALGLCDTLAYKNRRTSSLRKADAALAAIEASGFVIVPLEPTIKMCDAATRSTSAFMALEQRGADLRRLKHAIRWRAMLAARPRDTERE